MNPGEAIRREFRNVLSYLQIKFKILPRAFNRCRDYVLVYHGIDSANSTDFNWRFIHYNNFRDHILFLRNYFKIVPLSDIFERPESEEYRIAITLDDGYRNWASFLLPVLEEYQIPATLCITCYEGEDKMLWTDQYDIYRRYCSGELYIMGNVFRNTGGIYRAAADGQPLSAFLKEGGYDNIMSFKQQAKIDKRILDKHKVYWQLLDPSEIADLSRSRFVEIAAHGTTHASLNCVSAEQAAKELTACKSTLEGITGKEVVTLAFPSGQYSRETIQIAGELGFRYLLAEDYRFPQDRDDHRILSRVGVYNSGNMSRQLLDSIEKMK